MPSPTAKWIVAGAIIVALIAAVIADEIEPAFLLAIIPVVGATFLGKKKAPTP